MFLKLYKNSSVNNILVITLSNIGDAVLTAPVIDILLRDFPSAKLSLVAGAKTASLFEGNPRIAQIHIFDKKLSFLKQAQWTLNLRQYHFDLVIDLRNSMIGYFLFPKWITPPALFVNQKLHLKQRHLNRLRSLYDFGSYLAPAVTISPSKGDEQFVDQLLNSFLKGNEPFVIIAPYSANSSKTWGKQALISFINSITDQYGLKVVVIGALDNREDVEHMGSQTHSPILNLAGKTNLIQLAALFKRSKIAVVHDSGPMHIASYMNTPLVALFGPTNPDHFGPWGAVYNVVRRNSQCEPCLDPKSSVTHDCLSAITPQDVLVAFGEVYEQVR